MNLFIIIIISTYLLLSPFYVFPSGLPQPADFVAAIGSFIFLVSGKYSEIKNVSIVKKFRWFLLLVIIINVSYSFYYYAIEGIDNRMFFVCFFYIFNYLFFVIFLYTLQDVKNQKIIVSVIFISLLLQVSADILGLGFNRIEEGIRSVLFFNNPNQLGYFSLSMLTLFFILSSSWHNKLIFYLQVLTFSLALYLVFSSLSFAAIGGVIFIVGYWLFVLLKNNTLKTIIISVLIIFFIPFFLSTTYFEKKINSIEIRNEQKKTASASAAEIRGYDRFYIHPEYMLYGSGEGKNDRFNSHHSLEMHSGLGVVLFSYGILGFILFMSVIFSSMKGNLLNSVMFIAPVLIYNITHNGIRESLFWAVLAVIYVNSLNNKKIKTL